MSLRTYLVTLALWSELVGEYEAVRPVQATDADDACEVARQRELHRQVGISLAGGLAHDVLRVCKARKLREANL